MKRFSLLLLLAASAACSTSTGQPKAPASGQPKAPPPATQGPLRRPRPAIRSRLDPTVIEETETGVIRRLPKTDYVKVDDRHVKLPDPRRSAAIEFFKEDDKYYYVSDVQGAARGDRGQAQDAGAAAAVRPGCRRQCRPWSRRRARASPPRTSRASCRRARPAAFASRRCRRPACRTGECGARRSWSPT